jgi:hypothetical protein
MTLGMGRLQSVEGSTVLPESLSQEIVLRLRWLGNDRHLAGSTSYRILMKPQQPCDLKIV